MSEKIDIDQQVTKTFRRLRARLFNLAESSGLNADQCVAMKNAMKDFTSQAWNDISEIIEKK